MNNNFESFENDVMRTILENKFEEIDILKEQYRNSQVLKREFTGCGFFSNFIVNDIEKKLRFENYNMKLSCLGELEGVKDGVGFILFIKDGFIDFLEGYTYGNEAWPEEIRKYKLYRSTQR
jgi:hypothetical protein